MKDINTLNFGDIILVNYPFSDFGTYKKRPCLVLKQNLDDILVVFISSKIDKTKTDCLLVKSNKENNLARDSIIRLTKINTVHKDLIYKKIGVLSNSFKNDIKSQLLKVIEEL